VFIKAEPSPQGTPLPTKSPSVKKLTTITLCVLAFIASAWLLGDFIQKTLEAADYGEELTTGSNAAATKDQEHQPIPTTSIITSATRVPKNPQLVAEKIPMQTLLATAAEKYKQGNDSGAQLYTQRALSIAETKSQAIDLMAFADKFFSAGKPKLAEPLYRRALSILGILAGPRSPEYLQVLTKLSSLCHSMNRMQEENELNAYKQRLAQQS